MTATQSRRFPNNFLWDGSGIGPADGFGQCLTIRADREQLDLIAGFLLGNLGLRYPDEPDQDETDKPLRNLNEPLLNAARWIGLQLLHDSEDCMPFPILRINPENSCQTEQSLDGGSTWTTILDVSACLPTVPNMLRLRQNTTQPWLLEQSLDGGTSWTTAYDYSKYKGLNVADALYVTTISQESLTEITTIYNDNSQTVISIAPNLVYDTTSDDEIRDLLVCWACREVVKIMCEVEKARRDFAGVGAAIGTAVLGLVTVLIDAGIIVVSGGTGTPLAVGISTFAVASAGALWVGLSTALLTDESVREDVACCMYRSLAGSTPEKSAFEASLMTCDFESGSDQAQMAGAIAGQLTAPDIHAAWLAYAEENFRSAELGVIGDCECPDVPSSEWIENDFTEGNQHGWTGYGAGDLWSHWDGTGWVPGTNAGQIAIIKTITGETITNVEVYLDVQIDASALTYVGNEDVGQLYSNPNGENPIEFSGMTISDGLFVNPAWAFGTRKLIKIRYKVAV